MRDRIETALRRVQADYVEIRIEEFLRTTIRYRGHELEEIGVTSELGGNVRALVRGGWGFVSFNSLDALEEKVALAVREARLVGGAGNEKSQLAPVEPVVDFVAIDMVKDPRDVPLAEKKRLLDEYNDVMWSTGGIQTTFIRYSDVRGRKVLATSEGTYIEQEIADISGTFMAIARKDGEVQRAYLSLGSRDDYGIIENRHQEIKETAERAVALLAAKPVKAGVYTVVVDPKLAGVFVHEAFGHLSESDFVYENERMKELMVLGRRFGGEHLNILDGAVFPGCRGSYKYDDEGVPARKTYLVREGVLVGRLHSRETAGKMGEQPTGNARAISYRHRPIVRMTNTYIDNGTVPFQDMIADIKEGIYVKDTYGGQTSMEMFTFSAGVAYMIRNGEIAEMVRGVNLSGNVFETLANIEAIGNDFQWSHSGGGCGKGGQSPLPVDDGSPHLRIRNVVVGGE